MQGRPATHVLLCGVPEYSLTQASKRIRGSELAPLAPDPLARNTVETLARWVTEHRDDLAAPVSTCRLLSGSPASTATLVEFLRAAAEWRDDACTHSEGVALLYIAGRCVRPTESDLAILLADFGDDVGGLLYKSVSLRSLMDGMAPSPWNPEVPRTQLFFADLVGPMYESVSDGSGLLSSSWPTPAFDRPTGIAEDDRSATFFRAVTPSRSEPADGPASILGTTLIECLEGAASESAGAEGWAVTSRSLASHLPEIFRQRNRELGSSSRLTLEGLTAAGRSVVAKGMTPRRVKYVLGVHSGDGPQQLVVKDGSLATVLETTIPAHVNSVAVDLFPGLYLMEVREEGQPIQNFLAEVGGLGMIAEH